MYEDTNQEKDTKNTTKFISTWKKIKYKNWTVFKKLQKTETCKEACREPDSNHFGAAEMSKT